MVDQHWSEMEPLERLAYLEKNLGRPLPEWIKQAAQEAQALRDQERPDAG